MDVSTYLNYVIPLNWWKTELQDRYREHAGPASIVLATATIVSYLWGKYSAVGFLMMAFVTYPLSHKQIKYFMFLEVYGTAQAVACVAIPALCSKIPFLSTWSMPLHTALGYSLLTREWRLCQASCKTFEEIHQLQELNENLSEQVSSIQRNALRLKESLDKLTAEFKRKKQLTQKSHDLTLRVDKITTEHGVDCVSLDQQLKQLALICEIAAEPNGIKKQLSKVDQHEQRLEELTKNCESRDRELEALIKKIQTLKEDLSGILDKTISGEIQTQEGLKMIQGWLTAIIERKI